jgi:hypothetical protein
MPLDAFPDSQCLSPHRRLSRPSDRVSRSRIVAFPVSGFSGLSREKTGLTPQSDQIAAFAIAQKPTDRPLLPQCQRVCFWLGMRNRTLLDRVDIGKDEALDTQKEFPKQDPRLCI